MGQPLIEFSPLQELCIECLINRQIFSVKANTKLHKLRDGIDVGRIWYDTAWRKYENQIW